MYASLRPHPEQVFAVLPDYRGSNVVSSASGTASVIDGRTEFSHLDGSSFRCNGVTHISITVVL